MYKMRRQTGGEELKIDVLKEKVNGSGIDQVLKELKKNLQHRRLYLKGMKNPYSIDKDIYLFKREMEGFEMKIQDFKERMKRWE